jgi:uncharacterized protein (UPF0332 family)
MTFDWLEFLTLAANLAGNPPGSTGEAESRSAVSRAYYSMFHIALAAAVDFTPTGRGQDHISLQKHWERGKRSNVGAWLRDMYGWRLQCDYDESVPNLNTLVDSALLRAQKIQSILPSAQ